MTPLGILLVALGGAIGSVLRYGVSIAVAERFGLAFPYGTLVVNLTGSLCIGIVAGLAMRGDAGMTPELRLFLATGILGGFTTFSSFALENLVLVRDGTPAVAVLYALGSLVLGVLAASLGMTVARAGAPH